LNFATSVRASFHPMCLGTQMSLEEVNLMAGPSFVFIVITWYLDCDTFLRSFHNRFFRYSIQTDNQFINALNYRVLPSLLALIQNMLR